MAITPIAVNQDDACLAEGQDDQGRGEGADRRADIAADLEQRLRKTMPTARGEPRDSR